MSTSLWYSEQNGNLPSFDALPDSTTADVCIIGGGIVGLTTAYHLAREGRSVVVLDAGRIPSGETARTTAHLVTELDRGYVEIERYHGEEGARLAAESHAAAIDRIEAIVAREAIACDFERVDGYLFSQGGDLTTLEQEAAAARRAGVEGVEWAKSPLECFAPDQAFLRFPRQAQFHPLRYLAHLTRAIVRDGGRIHGETRVCDIDSTTTPARVRTSRNLTVTAEAVIMATNVPIAHTVSVHVKQASYRSYVLAGRIPRGSVPRALYWDTATPFHYVRTVSLPAGELLLVGGEDHKTGYDDGAELEHHRLLEGWARRTFPMLGAITHAWSGQVIESMDGLGFIGRIEEHPDVFVATGDSGDGLTHGTVAAMLLTDLVLGRVSPWTDLYDPNRLRLRALPTVVRESLGVAAQMTRWITAGEVASRDDVARGTGAVIREGATKVAAYRDASGALYECSAVCTHMKCIVAWNGAEQSWDCPCHGSRFDPYGHVLHGPARQDLRPLHRFEERRRAGRR